MSPHAAADLDGKEILLDDVELPTTDNPLVIELAGGLMVPLSATLSTTDLIQKLQCPVILVANYYLGSINHTLLSLHLLRSKKIPILGLIFNGDANLQSREVILQQAEVEVIADIPLTKVIDKEFIQTHAKKIRLNPAMARL